MALVGESGSGKSVSALSVLKLLPYPAASHPSGQILFQGNDLLAKGEKELRQVRGNKITMIFQEPMTSLNPLHTIEQQIVEVLKLHQGMGDKQARARTLELLNEVGIREPEKRLDAYPHQLSGGQRQRVMIAMALANEPELLIADEPTTALDVTVQAQILELLHGLKQKNGMSMLFITHDLGIVRKIADRVCVMTNGKIVESGPTAGIFDNPQHRLYAPPARRRAEGQAAGRRRFRKDRDVGQGHKGLVPDQAGFLPQGRRSCEGGRRHRRHGARRPDARRGRRIRLGQDHARPCARPDDLVRRPHPFRRPRHQCACRSTRCGRCGANCRSCSRIRSARSARACRFREIIEEGLAIHEPSLTPAERDARVVDVLEGSRPRSRDALSLSARIFRRPAPAHRHCARHGAEAALRHARRADLGARHERAGAGRRPACAICRQSTISPICSSATT